MKKPWKKEKLDRVVWKVKSDRKEKEQNVGPILPTNWFLASMGMRMVTMEKKIVSICLSGWSMITTMRFQAQRHENIWMSAKKPRSAIFSFSLMRFPCFLWALRDAPEVMRQRRCARGDVPEVVSDASLVVSGGFPWFSWCWPFLFECSGDPVADYPLCLFSSYVDIKNPNANRLSWVIIDQLGFRDISRDSITGSGMPSALGLVYLLSLSCYYWWIIHQIALKSCQHLDFCQIKCTKIVKSF